MSHARPVRAAAKIATARPAEATRTRVAPTVNIITQTHLDPGEKKSGLDISLRDRVTRPGYETRLRDQRGFAMDAPGAATIRPAPRCLLRRQQRLRCAQIGARHDEDRAISQNNAILGRATICLACAI